MEKKETIFTTITRLSNQHNAINLGQGFPNFDPDPRMVEIMHNLSALNVHQYAPMKGNLELIERIIEMTTHFYQRAIGQENVLVTAGATQAIFTTITALVDQGDEVILFDPAYDCYETPVLLRKAKSIRVNLDFPSYQIDWEKVESMITKNTRMIILNNPHNPSGATFTGHDIERLKDLVQKHPRIVILSDEVYEYISFEKHESLNLHEELYNRSVIISSFGKTLHLTGWKIGYLIAPKHLMDEVVSVHQYNVFSVNSFSQSVLAKFIDLKDIESLGTFFEKKKKIFLDQIKASRFKILDTGGTYFQLLDYSEISDDSDNEMALKMISEFGIASIPVSGFYKDGSDNKVLRFCFGKDDDTLIKAANILCQI